MLLGTLRRFLDPWVCSGWRTWRPAGRVCQPLYGRNWSTDVCAAPSKIPPALLHQSPQILQSTEKKQRYERKSSGANRGWLKKGPVGGARSSGGGPRSVVDDPLLGPPPDAEDGQQAAWEEEEGLEQGEREEEEEAGEAEEEEEEEEAGMQRSFSPETLVPPPTSSVMAPIVAAPVNGHGSGVASPHAAPPSETGVLTFLGVVCVRRA